MEYIGLFLTVAAMIPGILAVTDRFQSWRVYLVPSSAGIIGILVGISIARFIETDSWPDPYLVGSFAVGLCVFCLLWRLISEVANDTRDDGARFFFGACILAILLAGSIGVGLVASVGEAHMSDQEIFDLVEVHETKANYDRAVELLEILEGRYRHGSDLSEAVKKRLAEARTLLADQYSR